MLTRVRQQRIGDHEDEAGEPRAPAMHPSGPSKIANDSPDESPKRAPRRKRRPTGQHPVGRAEPPAAGDCPPADLQPTSSRPTSSYLVGQVFQRSRQDHQHPHFYSRGVTWRRARSRGPALFHTTTAVLQFADPPRAQDGETGAAAVRANGFAATPEPDVPRLVAAEAFAGAEAPWNASS